MPITVWVLLVLVVLNVAVAPIQLFFYRMDYTPYLSEKRRSAEKTQVKAWLLCHENFVRGFLGSFIHLPLYLMLWISPTLLWGWFGFLLTIAFVVIVSIIRSSGLDVLFDDEPIEPPKWLAVWDRVWIILLESPEGRRWRLSGEKLPLF